MSKPRRPADLVEEFEAELKRNAGWSGHRSAIAGTPQVVRRKVMPGETKAEARARWEREEAIEADRENDPHRESTGRIAPVFYD